LKVALLTLGCKVNSYETEAVWELLEKEGYDRVEWNDQSDVFIINTCSVTNTGEAKSRKMIRHAVATNPQAIVVVMGCFSQLKVSEVLAIQGVSIAIGTNHRDQIPSMIKKYIVEHKPISLVEDLSPKEAYDNLAIDHFVHHQRAFLKIQDGCNNFCSYCIIPYARGRIRSKAPEIVMNEALRLVESGFKEIILTGIHTGGYGQDLKNYRFSDLLKDLEKIDGLKRLRISSIEISELTEDVLEVIRHSKIIVNHLHIPLQSGSERILHLMNRKYTKNDYMSKIAEIRQIRKGIAITTDVIVGFPSETEAEFNEMMDFIRAMEFSELHVFPFSKRDGTLAASMANQIDGTIKKQRVNDLISLSNELSKKYSELFIGQTLEVIPESISEGYLLGHSDNYLSLRFKGHLDLVGQIVQVKLNHIENLTLFGEIIE
jgi:threonylcarbamoyladenosine tRNA methylthiotransferase MtaB